MVGHCTTYQCPGCRSCLPPVRYDPVSAYSYWRFQSLRYWLQGKLGESLKIGHNHFFPHSFSQHSFIILYVSYETDWAPLKHWIIALSSLTRCDIRVPKFHCLILRISVFSYNVPCSFTNTTLKSLKRRFSYRDVICPEHFTVYCN